MDEEIKTRVRGASYRGLVFGLVLGGTIVGLFPLYLKALRNTWARAEKSQPPSKLELTLKDVLTIPFDGKQYVQGYAPNGQKFMYEVKK